MIYLRLVDLLFNEHQPANYMLCLLSEENLFILIVDLNKTILAAFIKYASCQTPGKNKTKRWNNNVLFPGL